MDEHHFDALPPVNPSPEPQSQAPVPEFSVPPVHEEEAAKATELAPAGGFVDPALPPAIPQQPVPADDSTVTTDLSSVPVPQTSTPPIADDTDLIEKEWVEKAKQIVDQTKNDPHLQNEEINKVKADYLKKRYNHDLKVGKQ